MKKIAGALLVAMLTSTAMAAVSFNFGTNFFKPQKDANGNLDEFSQGQGQNFSVDWMFSDDTFLGYYNESTVMNDGFGNAWNFDVEAIQVGKVVMKGVTVGLNLGTFMDDSGNTFFWGNATGLLTDVFGSVALLSGAGDKVSGSLNATVAARLADDTWNGGGGKWNGINVGLAVGLNF